MNVIDWNELKNSDNLIISNLAYLVKDNEKGVQVDNDTTIRTTEDIVNWVKTLSLQGGEGAQGPQGIQGSQGSQGIQGSKGDKGEQGVQGSQGKQGAKGDGGNNINLNNIETYSYTLVNFDNWEIPKNNLDKLAVLKSDSLINVKWTPKKPIPKRWNDGRTYPANVEVTGIPYGATYECDKAVGCDVSIETFVTAVNNVYSLLYTERVGTTKPTANYSAWGNEYHGIESDSGYAGPYYANVCAEFVAYCLGIKEKFTTGFYPWLNSNEYVGKVLPNDSQSLRVGDIYYCDGHVALIKAIKRNNDNSVDQIIVSEQSSTASHETLYSYEEFNERIHNNESSRAPVCIFRNISLQRNNDMHKSISDDYIYNDDICTFAGDKACFREGELIVLNYGLKGKFINDEWVSTYDNKWTHIELYKNDSLINTYAISTPQTDGIPEDHVGHAYKLPSNLTYGRYKARVVKKSGTAITESSDYTYFDIIKTDITVEGEVKTSYIKLSNTLKISWGQSNGTPTSLKITGSNNSRIKAIYIFSDEEISNKSINVPLDWIINQSIERGSEISLNTGYGLRVYFKTDFGRVTNESIKVRFT